MTPREATAAHRSSAAPSPAAAKAVSLEQAEATLVEHYPRLVRIAYLVLPPELGRHRRVLTAHGVVHRALPRDRAGGARPLIPSPRADEGARAPAAPDADRAAYAFVRLRVLRGAIRAGRPRWRWAPPRLRRLPPLLPQVWGLRLLPRSGGADELTLDAALSKLSPAGRAAYVLRGLEHLADREVRRLLSAAGVRNAREALTEADDAAPPAGGGSEALLQSPEFDPCSLHVPPPDLLRRRHLGRTVLAAAAAVSVCGALLALPGGGWGPDRASAGNPAAGRALDPDGLSRAAPTAWRASDRTDFSVWPARGDRVHDRALLGRALAVWTRPGSSVTVSVTPGTSSGPPPGPARLLYAGEVDRAAVVLLYDGLRVVRYTEAKDAKAGGTALDFARTDGADAASANALVVSRGPGRVRYLTAPWVSGVRVRDLLRPDGSGRALRRTGDGVTAAVPGLRGTKACSSLPALELRTALAAGSGIRGRTVVTDLGESVPARLTYGSPTTPGDAAGRAARTSWAHAACLLPTLRSLGVRSVNTWQFAEQSLPGDGRNAAWVCTRAATWRGDGSRVVVQLRRPGQRADAQGRVAARAENTAVCGPREPRVLAGLRWKSRTGQWFVLAAGSRQVSSITASGGVRGRASGNVLALPATAHAVARLRAQLAGGGRLTALRWGASA